MASLAGPRLGAYELIERIGGGMAEVYRAKQFSAFGREVAIKVIRSGFSEDATFRERFLREAQTISRLAAGARAGMGVFARSLPRRSTWRCGMLLGSSIPHLSQTRSSYKAAFAGFEKTPRGALPVLLLDTHPDGRYVTLRTEHYESAVWEQESKRLVWAPPDAIALSWSKQGTSITGLFELEDSTYEFRHFSWPERQLLHTCPVVISWGGGRFYDVWISPRDTFALCRWWDQTEFGFEWLDITPKAITQDVSAGYFFEGTNEVSQPVFSPNGFWWICAYKLDEIWWAPDPEDLDHDQPARGGEYSIGELLIFRGKTRPPRTIPLVVTLPPGWLPEKPLEEALIIADPLFLDDHRIQIQLPSGEVQIHVL